MKANGNPVGVISNHRKPAWFDQAFSGAGIEFFPISGRGDGKAIGLIAKHTGLEPHNITVLAANEPDIGMGKNGGAALVAAGWVGDPRVNGLGIQIDSPDELHRLLALTEGWPGGWFYQGTTATYDVKALANLSSNQYQSLDQQQFGQRLRELVKNGSDSLNALLLLTARSLLSSGMQHVDDLAWSVYPSSSSTNDDSAILSDFTHRLRTTVSRVRFAKRDVPLFIRHTASKKRHSLSGIDRTDPSNQVETVQLNPFYKTRLRGRNVVVVDDCTTYGVSFAVASAFLRKAGAASVTGIAMGKFGNVIHDIQIEIQSDPFHPVLAGSYVVNSNLAMSGTRDSNAQASLRGLLFK